MQITSPFRASSLEYFSWFDDAVDILFLSLVYDLYNPDRGSASANAIVEVPHPIPFLKSTMMPNHESYLYIHVTIDTYQMTVVSVV